MRPALVLQTLLLACVLLNAPAQSQTLHPDAVVRSVLHDARGNYWFGTAEHGVYRFDGNTLTRFTKDDGLVSNQVRSLVEDRAGRVWFEGASGISTYDGHAITTLVDRDHTAKSAWELNPDDLWFKGDEIVGFNRAEGSPGVYRYDGEALRYHAFPFANPSGNNGSVTGIDQRRPDRVWIATYGGVIGFDGDSFTLIDDATLGHTDETGYFHARVVFEDSQERLWIGNNGIGVILREGDTTINFTQARGLSRRGRRSGGQTDVPRLGDAPPGQPTLHRVFAISEDAEGNIWFGTVEEGVWRFDGETLRQFTDEDGLETSIVTSIYTDRNGTTWFGGEGVFTFDGTRFERQF